MKLADDAYKYIKAIYGLVEALEDRIKQLEKENASLKDKLKKYQS